MARLHSAWWTLILLVVVVGLVLLSFAMYNRSFTPRAFVTLTSDRSGLNMEPGTKVKMRGVTIGWVDALVGGNEPVALKLEIEPDQLSHIPANVEAEINATTVFGNKFVELIPPEHPSVERLRRGAVLHSRNVATEVNTVFENLTNLLKQIDPAKLNGVLTTLAQGLGGQGERMGQAITAGNRVLSELNSRSDTIRQDWRSLGAFSDTYSVAAQDILSTLKDASTTSATITNHASELDRLLLNAIGLASSGTDLVGPNKDTLIQAVNVLEPTTDLLLKYNPEFTCLLKGAKWDLDNGMYDVAGGANGYSLLLDTGLLLGNDPYTYPDNLPIVAAKGGPGGKPSCGSLPDPTKNFPVRQLVTNTGWGTGMDIRDNVGLGHPCWVNYFPVTRAVPEQPSVRCQGPPSPGLVAPAPGPLPLPPVPGPPAGAATGGQPPP